jgi:hypothetical protein
MIAGFRRDVETVARGEGRSPTIGPGGPPAGSPVGSLGATPLRNPAEILTPDDWVAVPAVNDATRTVGMMGVLGAFAHADAILSRSQPEAPRMPLADPSAYAARAAGLDAILPVVRRATKASRGQFKASGIGSLLMGTLLKLLLANLPMLIDLIVDAWESRDRPTPTAGGGGPRWPEAAAGPLNPAVAKAIRDERDRVPEAE